MTSSVKLILQKILVYGIAAVILAVLQTAFFANLRIFGAVPNLMLGAVIAISFYEKEKGGAIAGIAIGFFIDALGGMWLAFSPLFFMLCGYICGFLANRVFDRSIISFAMLGSASSACASIITFIYLAFVYGNYNVISVFGKIIIPEFFCTAIFSFLSFFLIRRGAKFFYTKKDIKR